MAREFLLAGVDPEELKPTPKIEPPKTPKGKWENFWYHYKWHFWGGLFFSVLLVVLVVQIFSKNPADYNILLVTERSLMDSQVELIEQELAAYATDLDGDGEIEVKIQNSYLCNPGTQEYFTNQQVIQSHIFAGDVMLFIWEPKYYEEFITSISSSAEGEVQFLTTLPIPAEQTVKEGTLLNWSTHRLQKNPLLEKMSDQLYCGVRLCSGTASDQEELQQACVALLQALAADKPTQTPAS